MSLKITLPDDVMSHLPTSGREAVAKYLASVFDEDIERYNRSIQRRVAAPLNGPLSRYERSIIRDFLVDTILSGEDHQEEPRMVAESYSR